MRKLLFFVAAIVIVTVTSALSCESHKENPNEWNVIPDDTIIGGTHLEFDTTLDVIIVEKEDGSERESKVLLKEGHLIKFFTHDNHHFFKVWLENQEMHVQEEYFPVITWNKVPTDTIVGESRLQFDKENHFITIEDKVAREAVALNENDSIIFYPYDGYHCMSIWLQDGQIFVRDSLISPEL